jgi:hypothetical protein
MNTSRACDKKVPDRAAGLRIRPAALLMLWSSVNVSKIGISVAVGFALFAATIRLPATPCFVTNTPSPKTCEPDCCANKTCCLTSHERTGPAGQPFTKSPSDQQNIAAVAPQNGIALPAERAPEPRNISSAEAKHSPPTLALICIRLI